MPSNHHEEKVGFLTEHRSNFLKAILKKPAFAFGVLVLLLGVVAIILVAYLWTEEKSIRINGRFGITVDAGGSGTRLSVYEYNEPEQHLTKKAYIECEGKGLTNLNNSTLVTKISNCLQEAKKKVPLTVQKGVPLYFAATAGMRLLGVANKTGENQIWDSVRAVLNDSSFTTKFADTLSGNKEAIYSYTSLNDIKSEMHEEHSGMVEVGSTSMQFAFELTNSTTPPQSNREETTINSKRYTVFVQSYLCFGSQEFLNRYLAILIEEQAYPNVVKDPCRNTGFNKTFFAQDIWSSTCVNSKYANKSLGGSVPKPRKGKEEFQVIGTGNFKACYVLIKQVVTLQIKNTFQAPDGSRPEQFTGIGGGAFYSADFLNIGKQFKLSTFRNATEILCSLNFTTLQQRKDYSKYSDNYCLSDVYVYTLLNDVLTLNTTQVSIVNKLGDHSIKWARGLILNKLKELSPAVCTRVKKLHSGTFYSVLIIGILFAVIGIVCIVLAARKIMVTKTTPDKPITGVV